MENKITGPVQSGAEPILTSSSGGKSGLTRNKHAAVMRQAADLLSGADMNALTVLDSLNCGKLTRLINYFKQGGGCLLLWAGWAGCVVN